MAIQDNSSLAVGTQVAPAQTKILLIAPSDDDDVSIDVDSNSSIDVGPEAETVVGDQGKGKLNVRGFSRLNADGTPLTVGKAGMGMVMIGDSSEATAGVVDIGQESGSVGMVSVMSDQGTSSIAADQINVAVEGQGTLEVMDGGQADVSGEINVSAPSASAAPGGASAFSAALQSTDYGPGTLRVEGTGRVAADTINIGENGQLIGTGTVETTTGLDFSGQIKPGASPGILNIIGPLHQMNGGVVEIEITGRVAGSEYDVLNIVGDATFDGLIALIFDGYAPRQGDVFDFLMVDGQTDLTNVGYEVRNLLPGFEFDVVPTVGGIRMLALNNGTFVPEPAGAALLILAIPFISMVRVGRRVRVRDHCCLPTPQCLF